MQSFRRYMIALGIGFLTSQACRPPDPQLQEEKKVSVPKQGNTVNLLDQTSDLNFAFEGSLVFWNKKVTPAHMAEVSKISDVYLAAVSDELSYIEETIKPVGQKFLAEKTRYIQYQSESGRIFYESALPLANTWLVSEDGGAGSRLAKVNAQLALLPEATALSKSEIDHAAHVFAVYCDAKLWERAVLFDFLAADYLHRPSPLALCERIYQENGYFQGEQCGENLEGKNYFNCLWSEGVLKSELFQLFYSGTETGKILGGLDPQLAKQFFAEQVQNQRDFLRQKYVVQIPTADGGQLDVDLGVRAQPDHPVSGKSAFDLITAFEKRDPRSDEWRLLQQDNEERSQEERALLKSSNNELREELAVFAAVSPRFFMNEHFFNQPFRIKKDAVQNEALVPSVEVVEKANGFFPQIFSVNTSRMAEINQIILPRTRRSLNKIVENFDRKTLPLAKRNEDQCALPQAKHAFDCRKTSAFNRSLVKLNDKDITHAVLPSQVVLLKQKDSSLLQARVILNAASASAISNAAVHCFKLPILNEFGDEECAPVASESTFNLDFSKQFLTFHTWLRDPVGQGFTFQPHSPAQNLLFINEFKASVLKDAELTLQANLNVVKDVLNTLVGTGKLSRPKAKDGYYLSFKLIDRNAPARLYFTQLSKEVAEFKQAQGVAK